MDNASDCVEDTQTLIPQFQEAITALDEDDDKLAAWLTYTLAVGNITEWYQNCYSGSIDSLFNFYDFIVSYQSLTNYLLFWMLNLVVTAIDMVDWTQKTERYQEDGDTEMLIYQYALLVRMLFFYEYDEENNAIGLFMVPEQVQAFSPLIPETIDTNPLQSQIDSTT